MSQDDQKLPPGPDLGWLPEQSAKEWRQLAEALQGLRLMLAGLGLRHSMNENRALNNEALGCDIAAIQTALQKAIDHASETAAALRDLVNAIKGQLPPPAEPPQETIH